MKKLLIFCIKLYQKWSKNSPNKCKMCPTCSSYGITAIEKHGAIKGLWLTTKRLFRCASKHSERVDRVPENLKGDYKWLM